MLIKTKVKYNMQIVFIFRINYDKREYYVS